MKGLNILERILLNVKAFSLKGYNALLKMFILYKDIYFGIRMFILFKDIYFV